MESTGKVCLILELGSPPSPHHPVAELGRGPRSPGPASPLASHPWYSTQRSFCPAPSPTGGWALHPPSLTLGLGCFFPGAAVGLSLWDAGLWVTLATGAWGCGLEVDPIMGHFRHVCLGTGDPVCHGLACTQQNMQPCSLLGTCCFMASTVEMQDWCMCGIGCAGTWRQGFTSGILHCRFSALHSQAITAWRLLPALLITNHRDKVRAVWWVGGRCVLVG